MKIDLHVHTTYSSPCSLIPPERAVQVAQESGLDGIAVTEHDEIGGALVAADLGREYGFPVFKGIEIYTEFGDMLVFGLYEDPPAWKMSFEDLRARCDAAGAVIVPAHLCRIIDDLERLHGHERAGWMLSRVDALETHNGGCTPPNNEAALALAARHNLSGTGGSDAHHEFQIGRCFTVFKDSVQSDEALVAALKAGQFRGAYNSGPDSLKENGTCIAFS